MPVKYSTKSKSDYLRELKRLQESGVKILFAYGSEWNSEFYIFYEETWLG